MVTSIHKQRATREVEYPFSGEDGAVCPQLRRLLQQGYGFVILRSQGHAANRARRSGFLLACQTICSNGTELLHRYEHLTHAFERLEALEEYVQLNMLGILQRHFLGRDRLQCYTPDR